MSDQKPIIGVQNNGDASAISKFVSAVFRYDTNNMVGPQYSGCTYQNQGQCQSNCCEKEMER